MASREYVEALQELERLRAGGEVSQEFYDVHRARLLAEAARPRLGVGRVLGLAILAVVVVWIVVAAFIAFR